MGIRRIQCLICKEKLKKYQKNRSRYKFVPKELLMWMLDHETEEEAIEHIKKKHPKFYKETMKNG